LRRPLSVSPLASPTSVRGDLPSGRHGTLGFPEGTHGQNQAVLADTVNEHPLRVDAISARKERCDRSDVGHLVSCRMRVTDVELETLHVRAGSVPELRDRTPAVVHLPLRIKSLHPDRVLDYTGRFEQVQPSI